jgi:polysaccharide transporter, PST family
MKIMYAIILTVGAQLSKLMIGFVLLKMIAYYYGVEGLGSLGHFMTLVSIVTILAGGGIGTAIIKYVSEYNLNPRRLLRFITASIIYSSLFSVLIFIGFIAFSKQLSLFIFGFNEFYWIIILLAFAQFGFAFICVVTSVFNGIGNTKIYAATQLIGNLLALPVMYMLLKNLPKEGAAIAIIVVVFIQIIPSYYYFNKNLIKKNLLKFKTQRSDYIKLIHFTVMLSISIMAFPIVEILIRQQIITNSGYFEAGIWQGSVKLSNAYLSLFGAFLAYYYMPMLSQENNKDKIAAKLRQTMSIVMVTFITGATIFFIFRSFFIPLILSKDFELLEHLIIYQLIGDFFKICCHVVGFVAVAKAATKTYIFAEIFQSVLFIVLVWFFKKYTSLLQSVFIAYMLTNILYFTVSFSVLSWWLKSNSKNAINSGNNI